MIQKPSLGDALEKAFDRVVEYCFQPFDFTKWWIMGFVAWIASLGENGIGSGFHFNIPLGNSTPSSSNKVLTNTKSITSEIEQFIHDKLTTEWIIAGIVGAIVLLLIFLIIWLVVAWLKAKFTFIFIDNIINDRAEVKKPWREWDKQGTSLFKWKVLFSVISTFIMTPLILMAIGIPLKMCWSSFEAEQLLPAGKTGLIIGALFIFIITIASIILAIISFVVNKLIVPIMYKERLTIKEAWKRFRPVLNTNKGNITLFIIVYAFVVIAVGSVAAIALLIVGLLTCGFFCMAFIPLLSGFIVSIIMLPVTIFYRMFSYEYAMQFELGSTPDPRATPPVPPDTEINKIENFDPKKL